MKRNKNRFKFYLFLIFLSFSFVSHSADISEENTSYTYKILGTIGKGADAITMSGETMSFDETTGKYYYEFPTDIDGNAVQGTVYFYIGEYSSSGEATNYYGVDAVNSPTLLMGSNVCGSNVDLNQISSFYFTIMEGRKYKVYFDKTTFALEHTNNAPFYLEAKTINNFRNSSFSPRMGDLSSIPEDATIKSVKITILNEFGEKVNHFQTPVFTYTSPQEEGLPIMDFMSIFGDLISEEVWIDDNNTYEEGQYMYKLDVSFVQSNIRTKTSYSNTFFISNDGNQLMIEAYYLVQKGEGGKNNTYYTLPRNEGDPVYYVTKTVPDTGNCGILTFEPLPEGETIDFGDETLYKFTDEVLIRANVPEIQFANIVDYRLYTDYPESREGVDEEMTGRQLSDGRIILADTSEAYFKPAVQSDNRFMYIVSFCPLKERNYWLDLEYIDNNSDDENVHQIISTSKEPLGLTLPSPKLVTTTTRFFKGPSEGGSSDKAASKNPFYFRNKELPAACFHNLQLIAEMNAPNVTEKLGALMKGDDTGTFNYYFIFKKGDEIEKVGGQFNPNADKDDKYKWTFTGNLLKPAYLLCDEKGAGYFAPEFIYENEYEYPVYNRWGNSNLKEIAITDDAPNGTNNYVTIQRSELAYDAQDYLLEKFELALRVSGNNKNSITYWREEESLKENLLHGDPGSQGEYYMHVAVVDLTKPVEGKEETYELAEVDHRTGEPAEFIFKRTDIIGNIQIITFYHNHGKVYEGQLEEVLANRYFTNLEVHVSYLYPFNVDDSNLNRPNSGSSSEENPVYNIKRASEEELLNTVDSCKSDFSENVIKSNAMVFNFKDKEVATEVESLILSEKDFIKTGKGYIETIAPETVIYNPEGQIIAKGIGRHTVNSGIYIVQHNNLIRKVIVL